MPYRVRDCVRIAWSDARVVDAGVVIASSNGRSLGLRFEAVLGGHVTTMPVLVDEAGGFRSVLTGEHGRLKPPS